MILRASSSRLLVLRTKACGLRFRTAYESSPNEILRNEATIIAVVLKLTAVRRGLIEIALAKRAERSQLMAVGRNHRRREHAPNEANVSL